MAIKDIIEKWLQESSNGAGKHTDSNLRNVWLDGQFDFENLSTKLVHHIIEMIDEIKPTSEIITARDRINFLEGLDTLKQKLLQELGESKI